MHVASPLHPNKRVYMIRLVRSPEPNFAELHRALAPGPSWLSSDAPPEDPTTTLVLVGPVVLDAYSATLDLGSDDLVGQLARSAQHAAETLHGWDPSQVRELRSALWRSSHRFMVENVDLVDRGRELEELARLLRVGR